MSRLLTVVVFTPLKPGGAILYDERKRDAQKFGAWIQETEGTPEMVFTALRSSVLPLAEKVSKAAGFDADCIRELDGSNGPSSNGKRNVISLLREISSSAGTVVAVVSGARGVALLEELGLSREKPKRGGGLVLKLEVEDSCDDPKAVKIVEEVSCSDLPQKFPYPARRPLERRLRPAYYYRQSGVIPYREIEPGMIKVLAITSGGGKKWGIPKGIHEPGKSSEGSAVIEAFEEAGVIGEVTGPKIGDYQVEKWGAVCEVSVYPMRVLKVLGKGQWEESSRRRRWVTPQEAIALVENPGLAALFANLQRHVGGGLD